MAIKQENSLAQQINSFPQQFEQEERAQYYRKRGDAMSEEGAARSNLMNAQADVVREKIKTGNLGGGAGGNGTNALNATVPIGKFQGLPWRNLPTTSRYQALAEMFAWKAGALNTQTDEVDPTKFSPQDLKQYNQLLMAGQKGTINQYSLKRVQQANNVLTTMKKIDMTPVAYYSGTQGKGRLARDKSLASMGKSPDMYNRYQVTESQMNALVDQLTQYWGASITPQAVDAKKGMLNSQAWSNNPTVVLNSFNEMKNLIGAERQTNLDALSNPGFIYGEQTPDTPQSSDENFQQSSPLVPTSSVSQSSGANGSVVGGSTGKTYTAQDVAQLSAQYGKSPAQVIQILKENG